MATATAHHDDDPGQPETSAQRLTAVLDNAAALGVGEHVLWAHDAPFAEAAIIAWTEANRERLGLHTRVNRYDTQLAFSVERRNGCPIVSLYTRIGSAA